MTPQDFESFPVFGDNGSKVQPGEQKYAAGFVPGDVLPAEWLNWFLNTMTKGYNQLVQHANEGFIKIISETPDQPLTPTQEMSVVIDTAGVTLTLGSGPYTGYTLPVLATAACSVAYTGSGGSTTDTLAAGNARQYVWGGSAWLIVTQPTLTAGTGIDITGTTISAKQTYSTVETFTGDYWTDGKKIYKKVYTDTVGKSVSVSNSTFTIYTTIPNLGSLINAWGVAVGASGNNVGAGYVLGRTTWSSSLTLTTTSGIYFDASGTIYGNFTYNNTHSPTESAMPTTMKMTLTMLYTKTTD